MEMETLKQEILKLLAEGATKPREIRNLLNSMQPHECQSEVDGALRALFKEGKANLHQPYGS
jgi:hypothetical protein